MVAKVQLERRAVLGEEDCPRCQERLEEALGGEPGILQAHWKDGPALLCLHYDPAQTTAERVETQARRSAYALGEQYGHLRTSLTGLDCADCAQTVEAALRRMEGVVEVTVSPLGLLRAEYDRRVVSPAQIEARVGELGYSLAFPERVWAFQVGGMDCADCAAHIEEGVGALAGVQEVRLNFATGRMEVQGRDEPGLEERVRAVVRELGYRAETVGEAGVRRRPAATGLLPFLRRSPIAPWALGAAILLWSGLLLFLLPAPAWSRNLAFALATVVGGVPVARSAWAALRTSRALEINALMTIAGIGAMIVGEWAEGAATVFLFALGELIEGYTMDRARNAIRTLMDLAPEEATRLVEGRAERIPVEQVQVGDLLQVRPGERVPVDGEVVEGRSVVNQAAVTGESMPVEKGPGDDLYGGTLNGEGVLVIRATHRAQESTIARIIALVEEAQTRKAPAQRFVDRFARIYTPAVVATAGLVALLPPLSLGGDWGTWFYRALVLLVIACPCALVISTPVTIAAAIGAAARRGVLVKGGAYLEELGRLRALALDKTGTLTEGRPAVVAVIPYKGRDEAEVLRVAAAVEAGSTHPLARVIVHEARHRGVEVPAAQEMQSFIGRGAGAVVEGRRFYVGNHTFFEAWGGHPAALCREVDELEAAGQTAILVGTEEEVWGLVVLADRLRPQSRDLVAALHRLGVEHIVMLTGDNRGTAEAVAHQAGVDDVRANLLPEHKVAAVETLLRRFRSVGMVGDGVNDAPALMRASVGLAMGAIGSDTALETADVALMGDDLNLLPWAIRLGRRTTRTIAVNIAFALGIKALFLLLALLGQATLWMAVFADMGASLLVTLNGLRLLREGRI